ncbi:MAG: transcriptional regulator [Alphaproteobacteria bacterium HGW-Alphaproteobacteria-18]|nr:MAG: transcriptional regulator [Alphaproteobacteria bacterium HGW-Alphaproteobacteria-18]
MEKIDETDRAILRALQADGGASLELIAELASISVNTCWRRVKRLEESGVLAKRVALIDPDKVGLSQTVFVAIRTRDHSAAWLQRFASAVRSIPEVIEFYRMAGDVDYLLKVQVSSVADYDRVYKALIARVDIADVSATFAMECLKNTTELPI